MAACSEIVTNVIERSSCLSFDGISTNVARVELRSWPYEDEAWLK